MPDHYTTIAIGSARWDESLEEYSFNCQAFNEHKGNWNFCDQVRPMPEEVKNDVDHVNRAEPPWFVWANKHWGTKWGTYNEKAYVLGGDGCPVIIEFQSAWNHPSVDCLRDIARWMDERLGIMHVKFVGHQPYGNSVDDINLTESISN